MSFTDQVMRSMTPIKPAQLALIKQIEDLRPSKTVIRYPLSVIHYPLSVIRYPLSVIRTHNPHNQ